MVEPYKFDNLVVNPPAIPTVAVGKETEEDKVPEFAATLKL